MQSTLLDEDDVVMRLVEDALARPQPERTAYLRQTCGTNSTLCEQALKYIEWEERMGNFLLEPLVKRAQPPKEFEPGQWLIDRFRLVRKVGEGGMGTVWEAIDEKLDRRVAIKFPKNGLGRYLPPEVRNAREISHPNVCKIHEIHVARTDQGPVDFISMEFVEGETLLARLRRGALSKQERLVVAQQLCAGVAEAHRNGVIHRDLKSSNILWGTWPGGAVRVVVMDFGLAYAADASTEKSGSERVAGTPAYMAPELWKGAPPSVESDIYALGVVFWELLSGEPPEALGLTSSTLSWEQRPVWKAPTGYGRWDSVLARCLAPEPARRFHSVPEIAKALGPRVAWKWASAAAAAGVLAGASWVVSDHLAHRPAESVRLALLPFRGGNLQAAVAGKLRADTAAQLSRVHGNQHTGFVFVAGGKAGEQRVDTLEEARDRLHVSRVLQPVIEPNGSDLAVRVSLTDAGSGADLTTWTAVYKASELRYLPTALAGVVTETLHLAPVGSAKVNARALADYQAGLAALRRAGGTDEALQRFESAVRSDPDSALTFAGLAEARWFKYRLSTSAATRDGIRLTEDAIANAEKRNPDLPEVHRLVGLQLTRRGAHTQAIAEYQRAIELDPANGDAYRRLGEVYEDNNQLDLALGAYLQAVRNDPLQYRNQQDLGAFYLSRGRYGEAISQMQRAVALAPKEPTVHSVLSNALLYGGRVPFAEEEIRRSIQLRETAVARHQLGLILLYEGREGEAIPQILRAISIGPEKCLWWMNLGTAYRRSNKRLEAQKAYQRGLELGEKDLEEDPSSGIARAKVAYLCARLDQPGRAASEIEQALRQLPNDADVQFMAAWTYEALGRRDQALSLLARTSAGVIADVSRWPDLAHLSKDSRFQQLLNSHSDKASGG